MADPEGFEEEDDLAGLDLSILDLEHIELEDTESGSLGTVLQLVALLGLMGLILWLPQSQYYAMWGDLAFFVLCGAAVVVGLSLGRWFLQWAQRASERYARTVRGSVPQAPTGPPSALSRNLTLLAGLGGAAAVLFALPNSADYPGGGSQVMLLLGAVGALASALLLSRWVLMQAEIAQQQTGPRPTLRLPPWVRWATLAVLVMVGLTALIVGYLNEQQGGSESTEFVLGGVAFVLGICAAVWVGRHFDDTEAKLRQRRHRPPES